LSVVVDLTVVRLEKVVKDVASLDKSRILLPELRSFVRINFVRLVYLGLDPFR